VLPILYLLTYLPYVAIIRSFLELLEATLGSCSVSISPLTNHLFVNPRTVHAREVTYIVGLTIENTRHLVHIFILNFTKYTRHIII
jgi:hypothetical protein